MSGNLGKAKGFVVFAGSQAVLKHRPSAINAKKRREQLVEKGGLDENTLVFTMDHEFGSRSTAGGVVRGGDMNGLVAWKNSSGESLKQIEAKGT